MQSLALHALLALRKPQETQALALASSQSWLPLLRPSILIGWRLRLKIEWKPGFIPRSRVVRPDIVQKPQVFDDNGRHEASKANVACATTVIF